MNTPNNANRPGSSRTARARALLLRWLFGAWSDTSGQSIVEYLLIVGACALVGIAGFTRYGKAVKTDLAADAKHIEGEGLPGAESILSTLGADYNELPGWCVKPNYCFAAGTPVETEQGDRPIESIRPGDRIWARDVESGVVALRPVVNTYQTPRVPVVELDLFSGLGTREAIQVTPGHLFWVEGAGWVRADALSDQPLWSLESRLTAGVAPSKPEPVTVYNLEVSEFHSYFVGHGHVLVHNGDPNSSGCPDGSGGAASSTGSGGSGGAGVECGDSGPYRSIPTHSDMERDHIPSGEALKVRAEKILTQVVLDEMADRCRYLTSEEKKALLAQLKGTIDSAATGLKNATVNDAFTVALPTELHKAGRTRGGKNNKGIPPLDGGDYAADGLAKVKRSQRDSEDLERAAQDDIQQYEELLGISGAGGASFSLSPECLKKVKAAFQNIRSKTDADYEKDLRQKAEQQLDRFHFTKQLEQTTGCEPESAAN